MMSLKEKYKIEIMPQLAKKLGKKNVFEVPTVSCISVSVGMPAAAKDQKTFEAVENALARITGQKAVRTKAKKSISGFKIRQGLEVGLRVTLRGKRMWDFLDKLINVTLPRVRDFRGISLKSFDQQGNISVGFRECLPFPEMRSDEVEKVHGLEVSVITSTNDRAESQTLLRALGFPLKKD